MAESRMELFIETLTGTAFELSCSPYETIVSIKAKIQYSEGIPISQQHLIWRSQELSDDLCLQDYSIKDGATLKLVLGMRGGPINTKQVSDKKKIKELVEYVDRSSQTGERPLTVVVFHDGDKVHMYTLVEKEDTTMTPLSGGMSDSSSVASIKHIEEVDEELAKENEIMREKIAKIQEQLKLLNINKPKKLSAAAVQAKQLSKQTKPKADTHQEDFHLPPIHQKVSFGSHSNQHRKITRKKSDAFKAIFEDSHASNITANCSHLQSSRGLSKALKSISDNISTYVLSSPEQSFSRQSKRRVGSIYLPCVSSDRSKSRAPVQSSQSMPAGSSDAFFDLEVEYDHLRKNKSQDQLPLKCSAIAIPSYVSSEEWMQIRPRTSPEKVLIKGDVLERTLESREQKTKRKMKNSVKNQISVGSSSVMMLSNGEAVGCHLGSSLWYKDEPEASCSQVGPLLQSGVKASKNICFGDSVEETSSNLYSNAKSTKSSKCKEDQEGKKLPSLKTKKKSTTRCSLCSKKTGLATSYVCRCGKNFCATHRYAELHQCSYDYKTEGRRLLQLNNPVVTASKLPKI